MKKSNRRTEVNPDFKSPTFWAVVAVLISMLALHFQGISNSNSLQARADDRLAKQQDQATTRQDKANERIDGTYRLILDAQERQDAYLRELRLLRENGARIEYPGEAQE